ncbi:MAG: ABC-2 family transporter protein [Chloroflexi bacterium]|nr:ABC-2 family transporter protein [Chloroflexota bacterium]MCI0580010.1 ABC-2 family transporter protein [Chloroflexota bacterium]MCI0648465.1 ABC-2 family transporter protein [Chloroflexota bacterium]MCI0726646.1 ABC-2 family transporter protein [Chloroflexota bacterium]
MRRRVKSELLFLRDLMAMNLASAMEYRASFISQIVGMFINNGIYFVFWLIFFDEFGGAVQGYEVQDIFLLFAIVTLGFGLAYMFAANTGASLAQLIAQGRLDYYLVFPRNLLLHIIFSRMSVSTIGDITFGLTAYLFTGRFHPLDVLLFLVASVLAGSILAAFAVTAGSLAFYMGNAEQVSQQATNAVLTFALYPNSLFSGLGRFILYTLIPAGFVGAVPVEIVKERNPALVLVLAGVSLILWVVAAGTFYYGLRRYESGSAINVNV